MIKWIFLALGFYLGVAACKLFGVQAVAVATLVIVAVSIAVAAVAGLLLWGASLMRGRSHLWYLIPLLAFAGFFYVYGQMIATTPVAKSPAPAVAKVKPNVAAAVVPTTKSTTKPIAKLVVDEVEAHKRLHDEMFVRLQALAVEGARKGEGCISFTWRLASTSEGKHFGLVGLSLKQCIQMAKRSGVPILYYRRPDGSAMVIAPELAIGAGSGWRMDVDIIDGVPTFVLLRKWSIKGMP